MNETSNPPSTDAREPEFELLARETDTPLDMVREIYRVERDKLERSARIKTYVPVLAQRRVRALLQMERGKRYLTPGHIGQPQNSLSEQESALHLAF